VRGEAAAIVERTLTTLAPADRLLAPAAARFDSRDARLLAELVYGSLRWLRRLDHVVTLAASRPIDAIDPALLATLPEAQRREGMSEVVKTGLLAGEPLWELPDDELVRRCAAFKAAVCLRDPRDEGERAILNLGHTFAHALEAAAGYEGVTHGRAVALGLLAALRLSARDTGQVEEILRPKPVRVERERAWQAMQRDKKAVGGELRLVLLGDDGPRWNVAVPADDVRRELERLIA